MNSNNTKATLSAVIVMPMLLLLTIDVAHADGKTADGVAHSKAVSAPSSAPTSSSNRANATDAVATPLGTPAAAPAGDSAATPAGTSAPTSLATPAAKPVALPTATPAASSNEAAPPATTTGATAAPLSSAPRPVSAPRKNVADKPAPKGFDSAVKLYSSAKYAPAAAQFESFIKSGQDNTDTHMYLGACYQQMKKWDKALQQYDWVAKNAPLISEKNKGNASAHTLRCYRGGICPGNCLKLSTPGWAHYPDLDKTVLWMKFPFSGGSHSWSTRHLGEVIVYEKGEPVNKGKCPICGGTGKVPPLK